MKNITVTVTDDAYRAARIWAAQRGTSISRVVQYVLSTLPTFARANAAFPPPPQHANLQTSQPAVTEPSPMTESLPPAPDPAEIVQHSTTNKNGL